ncbi:hypothetical protein QQS45_08905 [Alteriqipengyuania flavescens]|uniref:hypothetical protein n=1 Tax=Alteriqipengyuania flavescens TaxID=3053610 RepID=UPI0025B3C1B8|nr:hypothetical protein [Alteriqipengyuania flavescens]WJY17760.1 hypothetical protein QQW98_08900 [Alteriqipengyuania flavescens]WJY23702.1 hypothetical protein QQS45_08905 [Alteriqipengyuania flavescens]
MGDYFNSSNSENFRGWTSAGGGLTENQMRTYEVFYREDLFILSLNEIVTRRQTGGVEVVKILSTTRTSIKEGEVWTNCYFAGTMASLSFYNEDTNTVRGFFPVGDGFEEREWIAGPDDCYMGE